MPGWRPDGCAETCYSRYFLNLCNCRDLVLGSWRQGGIMIQAVMIRALQCRDTGSAGMRGCKEGQRGAMGLALHVRKHPGCTELCQRRDEETRESLWVGIRGGRGWGLLQTDGNSSAPQGFFNHPDTTGETEQQGINNPEDSWRWSKPISLPKWQSRQPADILCGSS